MYCMYIQYVDTNGSSEDTYLQIHAYHFTSRRNYTRKRLMGTQELGMLTLALAKNRRKEIVFFLFFFNEKCIYVHL